MALRSMPGHDIASRSPSGTGGPINIDMRGMKAGTLTINLGMGMAMSQDLEGRKPKEAPEEPLAMTSAEPMAMKTPPPVVMKASPYTTPATVLEYVAWPPP
jgi:hypothetical protein